MSETRNGDAVGEGIRFSTAFGRKAEGRTANEIHRPEQAWAVRRELAADGEAAFAAARWTIAIRSFAGREFKAHRKDAFASHAEREFQLHGLAARQVTISAAIRALTPLVRGPLSA